MYNVTHLFRAKLSFVFKNIIKILIFYKIESLLFNLNGLATQKQIYQVNNL